MYTINPTSEHTHTFVFMHGRDSDAVEFASELFESEASDDRTFPQIFPHIKWVFPSAKPIPSERFGVEMSQWYDMYTTENPLDHQEKQDLATPVASIQAVLEQEAQFVPYDKIFIGGISQGCTIAVHTLLASPNRPLAGLVGLSSWLPKVEVLKSEVARDARVLSTPLLLEHNEDDDVIDIQ